MIVKISVTADDIKRGVPYNAYQCPVWHAVARTLPRLLELDPSFTVGPIGLTAYDAVDYAIEFPQAVYHFMDEFDRLSKVEPFEFDFDVPGKFVPAEVTP